MAKYRKKPVVIEAVQFNGLETVDDTTEAMFDLGFDPPDWIDAAFSVPPMKAGHLGISDYRDGLMIESLEGQLFVAPGDWIIRGVQGEIYPCKPDIFAATYEQVPA